MTRALVVLLALAAAGCIKPPPKPELVSPSRRVGNLEERLELKLETYPALQPWDVASLRGKVVLLDVWATWCEPCRESLPLYVDLRKEFGPQGFEVVAINVDDDPLQIPLFLSESKLDLPVVVDTHAEKAASVLKVKVMPTAFLLDRKGVIRFEHEGYNEDLLGTYIDEISLLLAEKP